MTERSLLMDVALSSVEGPSIGPPLYLGNVTHTKRPNPADRSPVRVRARCGTMTVDRWREEELMGKKARRRKGRKKSKANHGRRPNS